MLVGYNIIFFDIFVFFYKLSEFYLLNEFFLIVYFCIDILKLFRKLFKKEEVGNFSFF